jgi:dolichol-phosphate mannosyltransferase
MLFSFLVSFVRTRLDLVRGSGMKSHLHTIVVPVYNSKETLALLVDRISMSMNDAQIQFELVLVDDGSEDGSFEEIKRLSKSHSFVHGYRLSRNFGHQAALFIGLEKSRGAFVGIIDDDLQDPPEILPDFFQRLYKEFDVVYGIRRKRREVFVMRLLYAAFYRILRMLSKVEIPLDAGDFCVMKRCVVDAVLLFREANPFLRGIRSWVGFKQVGVEYERDKRQQGKSGYTLRKYFSLAKVGILSFSNVPLRLTTLIGSAVAFLAFVFSVYVICLWLIEPFEVSGYASLVVIIAFLGGVQLISIGILGEYLARLGENIRMRSSIAVVAETTFDESS